MAPDPNGYRSLHPKTPTKWAILAVSATQYPLKLKDYEELLMDLSYRRSRSSLRRALNRCVHFGLLVTVGRRKWRVWQMTARGRDLINAPRKKMPSAILKLVHLELDSATKWMCISDLYNATSYNPSTISRVLRSNRNLFQSTVIPGDRYRRKQWALISKDTTNWDNAVPTQLGPHLKVKRKMKQLPLPVSASSGSNPSYGGITMCLSPTTAAKPSLIQAVGDVVTKEFIAAQKKFTAHDVTRRMRELVALPTTTVNPAETGTVRVNGQAVPDVRHEDVREIVHELFEQGGMPGFGRASNGTHWEYDLATNIAVTPPAGVPVATPAPDPVTPTGSDGSSYDGSSTI